MVYDAINRFLLKNSILAPKTLKHIFSENILVIEDFGDITFKKALTKSKNKLNIYKRLVNELIKIQKIKPPKKLKIFNGKYS